MGFSPFVISAESGLPMVVIVGKASLEDLAATKAEPVWQTDWTSSYLAGGLACDLSYDKDHGKNYTSILTDNLVYPVPGGDFYELTEHSESYYLLDRMKSSCYDGIRDNERFGAILKQLDKPEEKRKDSVGKRAK